MIMPGKKERLDRQKEAKPSSTNQGYLASDRHAAIDARGYYFFEKLGGYFFNPPFWSLMRGASCDGLTGGWMDSSKAKGRRHIA